MSSMVVGASASRRRSLLAAVCARGEGKGTCGPGIQRALGAAHSIPACLSLSSSSSLLLSWRLVPNSVSLEMPYGDVYD